MSARCPSRWILPAVAAALAALPAAGCWRSTPPAAPVFTIHRVSPELGEGAAPLLLNDAITVYFSAPVDPMTVTGDSVAVLDAAGHRVPGRLGVEGSWVTFEPVPPVQPSLDDGSLQPDATYRFVVAGFPRSDGVRAADGRHLTAGITVPFRTAGRDVAHLGLPAPLQPVYSRLLPFALRDAEAAAIPPAIPADDPRLRLQFTLPILPTSVSSEAVEVWLLRNNGFGAVPRREHHRVVPRAVRVVHLPAAAGGYPGSMLEVDLGSTVRTLPGGELVALQPEDFVGVRLATGPAALQDYFGRPHQVPPDQVRYWSVVAGSAVAVARWPALAADERIWSDADLATPGFEITEAGTLRPLVRTEAGDGSLGVFRPRRATILAADRPFDRGDGTLVRGTGGLFAFRAIDVPAGVTVRIEARGRPVRLLAQGRIRIAGVLEIDGTAQVPDLRPLADVSTVMDSAAVSLLGAGGIRIEGAVRAIGGEGGASLALITAGALELDGPIPLDSILATERRGSDLGAVARCTPVRVRLTPGLPDGAERTATGYTSFVALPPSGAGGIVRIDPPDTDVRVAWQAVAADPVDRERPDADPGRRTPPRDVEDGQRIDAPIGSFVRMRCTARVRGGEPLPRLESIRLLDR